MMTRTVIDIDDIALATASRVLGTKTKVATVNAALAEVAKRDRQVEAVRRIVREATDLSNPDVMKGSGRSFDLD